MHFQRLQATKRHLCSHRSCQPAGRAQELIVIDEIVATIRPRSALSRGQRVHAIPVGPACLALPARPASAVARACSCLGVVKVVLRLCGLHIAGR